jgi:HAD superfamily hydrolase (TIGR01509 family)
MTENIVNDASQLYIESQNFTSSDLQIETIVFDLGGVFFTNGSVLAQEIIKKTYEGIDEKNLQYIFSNIYGSPGNLIRRGLISIEEFETKSASLLNIPDGEKHNLRHIWFSSYVPNYMMERIVQELTSEYRLVVFSGNIRERIKYLDKKYDFLQYFNAHVFSYNYQTNKRDINLYHELLTHLNCEPSQAIFIDDSFSHLKRAASVGLNGIHYCYTEKLLKDLKEFNIEIEVSRISVKNYSKRKES